MGHDVHHLLQVRTGDDSCRCLAGALELTLRCEDPTAATAQVVVILEQCLHEHPAGMNYRHSLRWR